MGEAKRRGAQKRPPTILLGYVHGGAVRHEFHRSVLETLSVADWEVSILDIESGPLLSRARNSVAAAFLDTDCDYLLSVDTDVCWRTDDLRQLLQLAKTGKSIVAGHYWGYANAHGRFSTAGKRDGDDMKTLTKLKPEGYEQVDFVGMGFTLVKRQVFEDLGVDKEQLWPFGEVIMDGKARGEDITFCMRAAEKGHQSWVSYDAQPGHVKSVII